MCVLVVVCCRLFDYVCWRVMVDACCLLVVCLLFVLVVVRSLLVI